MTRILMVATSHNKIADTDKKTGLWIEELTTPYYIFKDNDIHVDVVSMAGGEVPIDPNSLEDKADSVKRYEQDKDLQNTLKNSPALDTIDAIEYDGIFLPGGHGTMWDFAQSQKLGAIVGLLYQEKRPVAAVCHGPAGLINAIDSNGAPIVKGKTITAFTNSEEDAVGLTNAVPFLLEDKLKALGATLDKADDFAAHSVVDGNLITGQNPASSAPAAEHMVKLLKSN